MTVENARTKSGIEKADAEVLLSHVLKKPRTWIAAHGNENLSAWQAFTFHTYARRRRRGEPVAYITGMQEFYGRTFFVSKDVLIPRPATELLINVVKKTLSSGEEQSEMADAGITVRSFLRGETTDVRTIVDVGTGSGCIAITLAHENSDLSIIATDISRRALRIAKKNASAHEVEKNIRFLHGSLLEPLRYFTQPFFIVSNPPYIPEDAALPLSVSHFEPHAALFAGTDGTDILRDLMSAARAYRFCRGIAVECRNDQIGKIAALAG